MLCLVYEVEEYIITLTVFFFFKEKPRISEGEAAEDHPYPCCFLETDPSSSLNSYISTQFYRKQFIRWRTGIAGRIKEKRPRKERWSVQQFMIVPIITFGVFLAGRVTAWCSLTHLWRITLCYVMELSVIQETTVSVLLFCFPFLVMSCLITFFSIQQPFFYLFKFKKEPE